MTNEEIMEKILERGKEIVKLLDNCLEILEKSNKKEANEN
jgi:hypothetical protein